MTHGDLRLIDADNHKYFVHLHTTSDGTSWSELKQHVIQLPHVLLLLGRQWVVTDHLFRQRLKKEERSTVRRANYIRMPCADWWAYRYGYKNGYDPIPLEIKDQYFQAQVTPRSLEETYHDFLSSIPLARGFGLHGIASAIIMTWPAHFMPIPPQSGDKDLLDYWGAASKSSDIPNLFVGSDRFNNLKLRIPVDEDYFDEVHTGVAEDISELNRSLAEIRGDFTSIDSLEYEITLDKKKHEIFVEFCLESIYIQLLHNDINRLANGESLNYLEGLL